MEVKLKGWGDSGAAPGRAACERTQTRTRLGQPVRHSHHTHPSGQLCHSRQLDLAQLSIREERNLVVKHGVEVGLERSHVVASVRRDLADKDRHRARDLRLRQEAEDAKHGEAGVRRRKGGREEVRR